MGPDIFEFTGSGVLRGGDLMPDYFAAQQDVGHYGDGGFRSNTAKPEFDVFVYESWYPREEDGGMEWIKGNALYTPQQIGALRWIARQSGAKIVTQHPSDKKAANITMPGVFAKLNRDSTEQHDQDARMHLWLYFWRNWFVGNVGPSEVFVGV